MSFIAALAKIMSPLIYRQCLITMLSHLNGLRFSKIEFFNSFNNASPLAEVAMYSFLKCDVITLDQQERSTNLFTKSGK